MGNVFGSPKPPKPPTPPPMPVVSEETPEAMIRKQRRKSGFESAMNPTALGSKMSTGLKTTLG